MEQSVQVQVTGWLAKLAARLGRNHNTRQHDRSDRTKTTTAIPNRLQMKVDEWNWTYPSSFGTSGFRGAPSARCACTLGGREAYAADCKGWATKRSKYERVFILGGGGGGAGGIDGEAVVAEIRRWSVMWTSGCGTSWRAGGGGGKTGGR